MFISHGHIGEDGERHREDSRNGQKMRGPWVYDNCQHAHTHAVPIANRGERSAMNLAQNNRTREEYKGGVSIERETDYYLGK